MMKAYNLRKYETQRDMENLFRVYSDYSEQYKLFSVMSIHNYDSFIELFRRQVDRYTEFNIIEVDGKFAGFVAAYDYKKNDGHIKAMIYIEPTYRFSLIGLAGIEFINILFQYYNVRKIYTEVYDYNSDSIKYHHNAGFTEECRLSEYKYFDGKYWDVIYFSISRDAFYAINGKIIHRFLSDK